MMGGVGADDEFAEFDMTAAEFDRRLEAGEPVLLDVLPRFDRQRVRSSGYWTLTTIQQAATAATSRLGGWPLGAEPARSTAVRSHA